MQGFVDDRYYWCYKYIQTRLKVGHGSESHCLLADLLIVLLTSDSEAMLNLWNFGGVTKSDTLISVACLGPSNIPFINEKLPKEDAGLDSDEQSGYILTGVQCKILSKKRLCQDPVQGSQPSHHIQTVHSVQHVHGIQQIQVPTRPSTEPVQQPVQQSANSTATNIIINSAKTTAAIQRQVQQSVQQSVQQQSLLLMPNIEPSKQPDNTFKHTSTCHTTIIHNHRAII